MYVHIKRGKVGSIRGPDDHVSEWRLCILRGVRVTSR